MNAGLNIAALSRRTGVAADTLRKWEQRYGVLRPARTTGGQRRYSELDIDRVEWLRARLAEGYRIGEAAALLGTGQWRGGRPPGHPGAGPLAGGGQSGAGGRGGVVFPGLPPGPPGGVSPRPPPRPPRPGGARA